VQKEQKMLEYRTKKINKTTDSKVVCLQVASSRMRNLYLVKLLASLKVLTGSAVVAWGFLSPVTAVSQSYVKCTTAEGKVEFSDKPCPGPSKAEQLNARPNSLDNSGFRENALRQENQALRARLADSPAAQASPSPVEQAHTADKSTSRECTEARRSYDVAAGSINPNKFQIQAERSKMFLSCGGVEPPPPVQRDRPVVCSTSGSTRFGNYEGTTVCR